MRYIFRKLGKTLQEASRHFPAVIITGPRRAGKTTLLHQLFTKARYVLLEDLDIQGRIRNDSRAFLEELHPPVGFDEIQNAPELLSYVRTLIGSSSRAQRISACPARHSAVRSGFDNLPFLKGRLADAQQVTARKPG